MPNTLVHLCVQTPASRLTIQDADFKWIALGCIIPDIPWIMQRIITFAIPGINILDLRIYSIIQASLFFSLILSLAFSLVTDRPVRIFILLAFNVTLHLFLDALQIKWGNGVHFLVPFSWRMTNVSLFWPEGSFILVLSLAGLGVLIFFGLKEWCRAIRWATRKSSYALAVVLLIGYIALPFALFDGPVEENNHYVATLNGKEQRVGKKIEIDRGQYSDSDQTIYVVSGEKLVLRGDVPHEDALLSVRGYFLDNGTVQATAIHVHSKFRDLASIAGLAGILLIWLLPIVGKKSTFKYH